MSQKKQLAVLAVLLVVAGSIWYWFFFRDKTPASTSAVAVAENVPLLGVDNPELHKDQVDRTRKTEYKSNGRNIFSSTPPPQLVKVDKKKIPDVIVERHDPPPPPTLPVKFFGYGNIPNGTARRAFLTDGEDIYIVAEGDVLLNRFRILKVGNASLDFEEISSGRHGTANLEEQGAPPSA